MATLVKTDAGTWKPIFVWGWPIISKTFRTNRNALGEARRAEHDEMLRDVNISRTGAELLTVQEALLQ
jgi:hypothetical protein